MPSLQSLLSPIVWVILFSSLHTAQSQFSNHDRRTKSTSDINNNRNRNSNRHSSSSFSSSSRRNLRSLELQCKDGVYNVTLPSEANDTTVEEEGEIFLTCESAEANGDCNQQDGVINEAIKEIRDPISGLTMGEACCVCRGGEFIDYQQQPQEDGQDTNNSNSDNENDEPLFADSSSPTSDANTTTIGGGSDTTCGSGPILMTTLSVEGSIDPSTRATFPNSVNSVCMNNLETMGGWFIVEGTGGPISLEACSNGSTASSIAIRVLQGTDCDDLACTEPIARQHPTCDNGYAISWVTDVNVQYHVLVVGLPVGAGGSVSTTVTSSSLLSDGSTTTTSGNKERRVLASVASFPVPFTLTLKELTMPENNSCPSAITLTEREIQGDTTMGGNSVMINQCNANNAADVERPGVYYKLSPEQGGNNNLVYTATTCHETKTNFDAQVSVFTTTTDCQLTCLDNAQTLPCPDGSPGSITFWTPTTEDVVMIVVHGSSDDQFGGGGAFNLQIDQAGPLANDNCATAQEITVGTEIVASTRGAKPDAISAGCQGSVTHAYGVWYKFQGTGKVVSASTCSAETKHRTAIHVFSGSSCESLTCMDTEHGNSALCRSDNPERSATVNFLAQDGFDYFILVSSVDALSGSFGLTLTEVTPPTNDDCANAFPLIVGEANVDSTATATIDFPLGESCGIALDSPGVWYTILGDGKAMSISTCPSNDYSSAISIFQGSCNGLECITGTAAPDPSCETGGVTATWLSQRGISYYIFVHGESPNSMGKFELLAGTFDIVTANQFCPQALVVGTDGEKISGSTDDASHPSIFTDSCGVAITSPGLWYRFVGTGYPMNTAVCSKDDGFDVSVSVFVADDKGSSCDVLTCISGATFADSLCRDKNNGRRQRLLQTEMNLAPDSFSFLTETGRMYYIYVHGRNSVGDFELFVTEDDSVDEPDNTPIADLTYGRDLYRWTPMDTAVSIATDYSNLSFLLESQVTGVKADLDGSTIHYTPRKGWEGEDRILLRGCKNEGCKQFTVTIRVMGSAEDIANSPGPSGGAGESTNGGGDDGDGGGSKKLLWLLLIPLLCCLCCLLYYCHKQRQDGNEDENLGDTDAEDQKGFVDEYQEGDDDDDDNDDEDDDDDDDDGEVDEEDPNGGEEEGEEEESDDDDEEEDGDEDDDDGEEEDEEDEDSDDGSDADLAPPSGRLT
ncbi:hypothetical protein IV203_019002 [Nitzschia inconspicua]|uniref:Uncharacterized protein n=1 Tax=Nitzschia inconspicua TaxID=303405 RepID=A0A9K3LYD7_9STRA|nr:hypothetical protein IV203_019002 [Nitzschia inconspicua]